MIRPAIEIHGLRKTYRTGFLRVRRSVAIDDLDLEVREGEILGFLGPNGAGKTTTFKLILGLVRPDRGSIYLWGEPSRGYKGRSRIGFLPESPYFYSYLTAAESLDLYARLFGLTRVQRKRRVNELLASVGLEYARDRQLRKFSKGMLQRIGIAQALINDPKLLILDEPMSGLDPIGRKEMRDIVLSCRSQGKTVIFSTHIISDVEMICDQVAIILNGKVQKTARVDEILDREIQAWDITYMGLSPESSALIEAKGIQAIRNGDRVSVKTDDESMAHEILEEIERQGGRLISFAPRHESLEDIFLKKAGKRRP